MVTPASPKASFAKHFGKLVSVWWLVSTGSSLVLLQPFEAFLQTQTNTARLQAYDPFVLLVTLQRQQSALSTALATTIALLVLSVLLAQLPLALTLISLARKTLAKRAALLRALRVLPALVSLSILAHAVPLAVLLLVTLNAEEWTSIVVDGTIGTLALGLLFGCVLLVGWLFALVWLDLARIAVVTRTRKASTLTHAIHGVRVLGRAPVALFLRGTLARAATLVCLTAALGGALALTNSHASHSPYVAWFVTQAGVIFGLGARVWWLAWATRHYSLRPPSLNS